MTRDLRTMEWTWHVDLDLANVVSKEQLIRATTAAYNVLNDAGRIQRGDFMVIAVVRPPKPESEQAA